MKVEFFGQSARDSNNRGANSSRLVNCRRVPVGGSETAYSVVSVLGQEQVADFDGVFARAFERIGDLFYAVVDGALYSVTDAGVITNLGSVPDDENTTISSNDDDVVVTAGGEYRVWDGATLTKITPDVVLFPNVGSAAFLRGHTLYAERDGVNLGWSALLDASDMPALNFAASGVVARPDKIVRILTIRNMVWIFKQKSTEIWSFTGLSGANAFKPVNGGVIETGLKDFNLLCRVEEGALFVGDDNVAYITEGGAIRPVSRGVEGPSYSIANETPKSCFFYEDEGSKVCVITFENRPAWCFDLTTGEWHERAEALEGAWSAIATAKGSTDWHSLHIGGKMHKMTRNNTDADKPLRRRMISHSLGGDRVARVAKFEAIGRTGHGAGKCWLRTSRDRGQTWSTEKWRELGDVGKYETRLVWRSLGQFRAFTVELACSEPHEVTFNSSALVDLA
jgi:hypothetical protein